MSGSKDIILKGKDLAFWKEHSEFLAENMKNFGTPTSFKLERKGYPGSDENWDLLERILLNPQSLFIQLGDKAVVNPRLHYTQKDIERILDFLMYVPHKNSLADFVKRRVKRSRKDRRILKMTPQAVISRGNKKPRKSSKTRKFHSRNNRGTPSPRPLTKRPTIHVSSRQSLKKKRKIRHRTKKIHNRS
jgi:hypothetical protein